jgi:predicted nucleic-acid-binding protein
VIETGDVFIGTTVILETEWVLRAGYGFASTAIAGALRGLGGLAGISIEESAQTAQALDWMTAGMDFADALHLARSSHCSAFVTFDKKFAMRCKGKSPVAVESI